MPRPYWSGQVQISLVSFGIEMIPATEPESGVRFHEIDRSTGERIHHQNIGEGGPVDRSGIVKGYEFRKGEYVTVEPEEIKSLRLESQHTFEIKQFVDAAAIDLRFFEKPYFVVPQKNSQAAAFAVIRKALQETGKAGLGEITFGGREHLVALMAPSEGKLRGMMAYVLRYEAELRDAAEYFSAIKSLPIDAGQLALAKDLIERITGKFDASKFTDDYEAALRELIAAKLKHKQLPKQAAPRRAKVINLMDALRRSVEQNARNGETAGQRPRKPAAAGANRKQGRTGPALVTKRGSGSRRTA